MDIIQSYLKHDNYSGVLVFGSHIDDTTEIFGNTLLIPLKSLYHNHYIEYLKDFFKTFNYKYADNNIDKFNKDYSDNIPVCYIICKTDLLINISEFDAHYHDAIENAELFLTLVSGQSVFEFFKVAKINGKFQYKTELFQFNKLHRLWLNIQEKVDFVNNAEKTLKNQRFAISLFHDANKEVNYMFKIARYFMVLESITGSTSESKNHIRTFFSMFNYSYELNYFNAVNNYAQKIDAIEIAGTIRAKLFHGVELKYKHFNNKISREEYNHIIKSPENLSRHMRELCETAFFLKNKQIK
jgi:hypothetical protein